MGGSLAAPADPYAPYAPAPYAPPAPAPYHAPAPAPYHPPAKPHYEEKIPPKPYEYGYAGVDYAGLASSKTETQDEYGAVKGNFFKFRPVHVKKAPNSKYFIVCRLKGLLPIYV